MAWLIRREGATPVLVEGEITVGRASYSTIWLDDTAVSRTHCRFTSKKGQLVLRDESSNGTFVNGVRSGRVAHLSHGDIIQVAGHTLTIQETPAPLDSRSARKPSHPALPPDRGVHTIPPAPAPPPAPSVPRPAQSSPAFETGGAERLFTTGEGPALPRATVNTGELAARAIAQANELKSGSAVGFASGAIASSFQVQVVEEVSPSDDPIRYRDAVRLADGSALAVVTDLVGSPSLSPELVKRWKTAVRAAGARALGPDAVLQALNLEIFAANLKATALCARLEAMDSLLAVSCAGTPPPWIVRASRRVVRVQATASVGLGAVKSAQWAARSLHFERGDTLLLASAGWAAPLEDTLEGNVPDVSRIPEWLRGHPGKPHGGCVIVLTMT